MAQHQFVDCAGIDTNIAIITLFSNSDWIAAPIIMALAALGFGLGWLETRSEAKPQRKR